MSTKTIVRERRTVIECDPLATEVRGAEVCRRGTEKLSQSVLDQAQLAGLRSIGEADFLPHLIDLFIDQSDLNLKSLHAAIAQEDQNEILQVAHQLKGSSANMGATNMSFLAGQLESRAPGTSPAQLLLALNDEFALVRRELGLEREKKEVDP